MRKECTRGERSECRMIETENLRGIFQKPRKGNRILSGRLHGVS